MMLFQKFGWNRPIVSGEDENIKSLRQWTIKCWSEKLTEPGELKTSSVSFKFFLKNSPHPLEKFEISLNWLMYYSNIKLYESFMINQKRQNIPEAIEGGGMCDFHRNYSKCYWRIRGTLDSSISKFNLYFFKTWKKLISKWKEWNFIKRPLTFSVRQRYTLVMILAQTVHDTRTAHLMRQGREQ